MNTRIGRGQFMKERGHLVRAKLSNRNTRTRRPRLTPELQEADPETDWIKRIWLAILLLLSSGLASGFSASTIRDDDWPQLAREPGRTAQARHGVPPPYRARWIWCGPERTLRNKAANPAWPDDLAVGTKAGVNYPMPENVPFTLAGRAQPVVADGKVFIGDLDGKIYGLSLDDGRTLWVSENPGGTGAALAVLGGVVVATALPGALTAFDVATGRQRWRIDTPKAITGAPLVVAGIVYSGCHDGRVYAVDATSGTLLWTSPNLGAAIVGELCGGGNAVFVGAENMFFYKLDAATGQVLAKARLNGQSFRLLHPVLHQGLLFVQTVQPICVGSEYLMEGVMRDSPDLATEQTNILRWLSGDTNGGQWRDASPAWKHLFVLRSGDLTEPFTVPNGPADGCGMPAPPPVVDGEGRVLAWFKTAHPTLTARGSFGTRYSMDLSAIDLTTGLRGPIDHGRLSGTTGESDNLFALSSGGSFLYLRQRFRGTKVIDLSRSTSHMIQAAVRTRDGGNWLADVVYRDRAGLPRCSQPSLNGREAVVIAGDKLVFAFQIGTNFAAVEVATQKYWKERYEPRQRRGVYQGWMFLDLCPEVGRYLSEHVKDAALERHSEGLKKYPLFWLREAPYSSRWTGDEGLGIPTELMGMIVPMERWVAGASPATLARYTRSSPICLGDCYWIEALIQAIEAGGPTEWVAVPP